MNFDEEKKMLHNQLTLVAGRSKEKGSNLAELTTSMIQLIDRLNRISQSEELTSKLH